jgi:hypothetical protein
VVAIAVELATAYISLAPSARGMGKALDRELSSAGTAGSKAFGSSFTAGMASVGKVAATGLGVAMVAAGGVAAGLYQVGESFDNAYDKIRVGTGKTGEALAGLEGDFKAVATTVPASFEDASTAVTDLSKRLGLTGGPLQGLSGQFLELSRITGTDVATNIDSLTRVFGDWQIGVDAMPGTLDKMYRAAQASGIGIDDLGQSVVQFGAPLRNLGFGFDESIALISQFNKTGVNTETVFAGMKAGVGKMAKAGEAVPDTFRRVVDEITRLGPGTESTGKAIELFGQRAGPDLADAIAGGKFEITGMLDAISNGTDTVAQAGKDTGDFAEKLLLLKNQALVRLEPIALRVFGAIGDGIERVAPLATEIAGGFAAMYAAFTDGGNEITSSGLAGTLEGIGVKLRDVFDQIAPRVTAVVDAISAVDWAKVLGDVADVVTPIADAFVNLALAVADFAVDQWPKVAALLPVAIDVAEVVGPVLATAVNFLADNMTILGPALVAVAAGLVAIKAAEGGAALLNNIRTGETVTHVKQLNSNFDQFLDKTKTLASSGSKAASGGLDTIRLKSMYAGEKLKAAGTSASAFGSKMKTGVVNQAKAAGTALSSAGSKAAEFGTKMLKAAGGVVKSTAAFVANKAALVAQKIALAATTVATTIATGATAAFNFVMALNPVVLVVLAIVALIAILVLAYAKVDWFRAFVDKAFAAVRDGVVTAVSTVRDVVLRVFSAMVDAVTLYVSTYVRVVTFAFRVVRTAIEAAVDGAKFVVKAGFALIKAYIVDPVLAAKDQVGETLDKVASLFTDLPGRLGSGLSSLASTIAAPFKAMGQAIKDAWNNSVGGKGFTIPDIPGVPGRGTEVEIPRLHAGGPVTGRSGREVLRILEAGEWVLSRDEVANIAAGGRPPRSVIPVGGDIGGGRQTIQVTTVANATADEVVDAVNAKLGWKHTTRRDR